MTGEVAVADIACPSPCNVSPLITWNEKEKSKTLGQLGPLKLRKPKHDQCAINKDAALYSSPHRKALASYYTHRYLHVRSVCCSSGLTLLASTEKHMINLIDIGFSTEVYVIGAPIGNRRGKLITH